MLSLPRLFGRTDRFFDLLETSADEARRAADAVHALIAAPGNGQTLEQFIAFRREDKRIREEISRLVCNTFITPLDREDIDALSSALSRIPKVIKKFVERLMLLRPHIDPALFSKQSALLRQATQTLDEMVRQLRHPRLDVVQAANDRLHQFEAEGDKVMLELMQDLYGGQRTALEMIVHRDLFELLEKVIDRCRDAGNVIFQIVLKNS